MNRRFSIRFLFNYKNTESLIKSKKLKNVKRLNRVAWSWVWVIFYLTLRFHTNDIDRQTLHTFSTVVYINYVLFLYSRHFVV